jgi:hypothetical protein
MSEILYEGIAKIVIDGVVVIEKRFSFARGDIVSFNHKKAADKTETRDSFISRKVLGP